MGAPARPDIAGLAHAVTPNEPFGDVLVRAGVPEDVDAITRIERETFSKPWSARSFRDLMRIPSAFLLVAARATDPVQGYAVAYVAADVGELANFAVAPGARGKGVGRTLLNAVLQLAMARGAASLYLDVRASNVGALALYTSAAFAEVARRKAYYTHPVEDAIVMRRSLP